jgi:hypothetical protein
MSDKPRWHLCSEAVPEPNREYEVIRICGNGTVRERYSKAFVWEPEDICWRYLHQIDISEKRVEKSAKNRHVTRAELDGLEQRFEGLAERFDPLVGVLKGF